MGQEEVFYQSLKWSLIVTALVNIIYTFYILLVYMKDSSRQRSLLLLSWAVFGVIIFGIGLFGALVESSLLVIIFGVAMIINMLIGLYQGEIYKGYILIYLILIILAFIFAYMVNQRGR